MIIRCVLLTVCWFFLFGAAKAQAHTPCLPLSGADSTLTMLSQTPELPSAITTSSESSSADACDSCADGHGGCCWASLPDGARIGLRFLSAIAPHHRPLTWPSASPGLWLPPPILSSLSAPSA